MEVITLPVPDKLLELDLNKECEILNKYIVDISSIKYDDPELENNKIECSLVYFRNIDLPLACDFTKLSYEEKEAWIVKYISCDLFDLVIRELLETTLNLLVDEPLEGLINIFNEEETKLFKDNNKELLADLLKFIISLRTIIEYAVARIDFDTFTDVAALGLDLPIIKEKPLYFETVHSLLKLYPLQFDAINLYYADKIDIALYEYVLLNIEKSSVLYTDYLNLPSVKFIGLVISDDVKG